MYRYLEIKALTKNKQNVRKKNNCQLRKQSKVEYTVMSYSIRAFVSLYIRIQQGFIEFSAKQVNFD